jgi:hypothetical protein
MQLPSASSLTEQHQQRRPIPKVCPAYVSSVMVLATAFVACSHDNNMQLAIQLEHVGECRWMQPHHAGRQDALSVEVLPAPQPS